MTRETKIGLLVGLAFIIVIGILLSDHLTSSTDPTPATLVQAGPNVLNAVKTPGQAEPPITQVTAAAPVQPQQPVLTREELTQRQAPPPIVHIGPGQSPQQAALPLQPQPIVIAPQPLQTPVSAQQAPEQPVTQSQEVAGADPPAVIYAPVTGGIQQVAQQYGEEIISSETLSSGQPTGTRQYVAQSGDSLSRMASRLLGSNTKANREAIIKLNPSLASDPNKIILGKTYLIPAGAAPAPQPAQQASSPAAPIDAQSSVSSSPEYWYTTKEGDSLWKIAEQQLGDGSAYTAIKELNKQALGESDVVRPDMKLRLPARPLASAE